MSRLPMVRDYMATDLATVRPETNIYDAVRLLLDRRFSGVPVTDDQNRLVGLLSEKDCLSLLAKGQDHQHPQGKVRDFMATKVVTVPPSMDIYYLAGMFLKNVFRRFPVVENGRLVGQISRRDALRALRDGLGKVKPEE